ncbi:MAG: nucleotidyltransferase family protein [Lachnospiraceae bacterium]|nr:nucleotidyltransferase family protein [Lachnospiraceae bacterium]
MFQRKNIKICGIIAEYNPLHKGHVHHLERSKEIAGADMVIVVMSGDFVQRGAPAVCNKYERTRMALLAGADLVIELPTVFSLSSAEGFAEGGIRILDSLGCVDSLCFGSECGDIEMLKEYSEKNVDESSLRKDLKNGNSYASSYGKNLTDEDVSGIISCPNNILGIEYLRAISRTGSRLIPYTVAREGQSYSETKIDKNAGFASASAIRESILENRKDHLAFIPSYVDKILSEAPVVHPDMFSDMLYYKLISEKENGFTVYADVNEELSNKIIKHIGEYKTLSSLTMLLKSKNLTYTRISRCLFHILLDIKKEDATASPEYIRILGFKKDSSDITGIIKQNAKLPLITKLADAPDIHSLKKDIDRAFLYEKAAGSGLNEYRTSPVII